MQSALEVLLYTWTKTPTNTCFEFQYVIVYVLRSLHDHFLLVAIKWVIILIRWIISLEYRDF